MVGRREAEVQGHVLDRARSRAAIGEYGSASGEHAVRWSTEAAEIRWFIDEHCWSANKGSYVWYAGGEELDESMLLMAIMRYDAPDSPRLRGTVDAVRRGLASGGLLYRYTGHAGIAGGEGAFSAAHFGSGRPWPFRNGERMRAI